MHSITPPPCRNRRLDDSWTDTLDRLRAFVAARVDDRELAADITQDVIVRSIASGALDRVDNPAAWLYRSARNAVIDHYRTRRAHDPLVDPDAWPDPDGSTVSPTRQPASCRAASSRCSISSPAAREALCASTSMGRPSSAPPVTSDSRCRG